jgi:DNA repair exonuclease SbcCD ATPase subunit
MNILNTAQGLDRSDDMSDVREPITEEYIEAFESDLEELKSKDGILKELVNTLKEESAKIEQLKTRIERMEIKEPDRPGALDLKTTYEWEDYFKQYRTMIDEKKKQAQLKKELDEIEDKYEKIQSQIITLIPPKFHNIQIHLTNNQKIEVRGSDVITFLGL